jgi:hypothetical protein
MTQEFCDADSEAVVHGIYADTDEQVIARNAVSTKCEI